MTITPTVSVVIPAFNREWFIGAAIDSALAQTLPADEIIVVDDGSTDRTAEIAASYPAPVRLIQIENNGAGPSRPRNVAITAAKSEFIMILDSDDRLSLTVVERHRDIFARNPDIGMVCHNFITAHDRNGELTQTRLNEAELVHSLEKEEVAPATFLIRAPVAYRAYCRGNFIKTPGVTFRKRTWEDVGRFDETLRTFNDTDFFFRILSHYDMVYIDKPLVTVVFHNENISSASLTRRFVPHHYLCSLQVLEREYAATACRKCRRLLQQRICEVRLGLAYNYRDSRDYLLSLKEYIRCFRLRAGALPAATGIAKVPICFMVDIFRQSG